ncbi:copper resistance protein CopC [Pseudoclavibacter endophyticus]|uniref:Copper resistance protein CopC n=1 Tax=Pseudoclavibacter endophyticus TaxID=1778590 RepID=A0A6H9WVY6_9MICO|nr:copper resistance CopC family protein [Pseudoclavibacter endophyticus]KAB1650320.1 copper resistance protein CopC [Pseudoclavibacter endophyticus]GGA55171.1 copper resistance protein CopC [Pseudoclavibacter endophyticus]
MRIITAPTAGASATARSIHVAAAPSSRLARLAITLAAALLAAVIAAFTTLGASPASAHSQLVSSSPASDDSLDTPPSEVSLTFNEDLIDYGGAIEVVDADETDWSDGELTFTGPTVTVGLSADMPAGSYEVHWQVVSADGHPVSGVIPFTVDDASAETPGATNGDAEPDTAGADGLAGATATPAATAGLSGDDVSTDDAASDAGAGLSPWIIVLIVVAVIVVAAAIVFAVRRRPHTGNADATTGASPDAERGTAE